MRVCVVGGGGREHALALALSRTAEVVVAPGNAGTRASTGGAEAVRSSDAPPGEIDADLFVVGPEAPLVAGLADRLRADGKVVLGPGADGARLEGSKAWMKEVLQSAGVPTAEHATFSELGRAKEWLSARPGPYVVKTDGLAAGKGVLVTDSLDEALGDVEAKLSGRLFGEAGRRVVLEEALAGEELSLLALCDGRRAVPLEPAQDYKRLRDGDRGPNTGGMGAYSPVPAAGGEVVGQVMDRAIEPLLAELRGRGIDYRGVLYAGLMLTPAGPTVVEFNVRFGDPETQAILPRLSCDLASLLMEAAQGRLRSEPGFTSARCVTVVMAAAGYPREPRTGEIIEGMDRARQAPGVTVFHAGTATAGPDLVTSGGRVLDVTGTGATISSARAAAYEGVRRIHWEGAQWRSDIALAAAAQEAACGWGERR